MNALTYPPKEFFGLGASFFQAMRYLTELVISGNAAKSEQEKRYSKTMSLLNKVEKTLAKIDLLGIETEDAQELLPLVRFVISMYVKVGKSVSGADLAVYQKHEIKARLKGIIKELCAIEEALDVYADEEAMSEITKFMAA